MKSLDIFGIDGDFGDIRVSFGIQPYGITYTMHLSEYAVILQTFIP